MISLRTFVTPVLLPWITLINPLVVADSGGSYLWKPPINNEGNGYPRAIQLQHAGDANGRLLAVWEHWYTAGPDQKNTNSSASNYIIRESKDLGATWKTLSTVDDTLLSPKHATCYFWQPFLFEFPQRLGNYSEGTLLLVGNLFNDTNTEFFSWRSKDYGRTWDPVGGWQYGGTTNASGIWEPFLYVDSRGRVVAIFSDERDGLNHSQMLVHVVSNDGGDTWGPVVRDVVSSEQNSRPGMATVTRMDNGQYFMSYEWRKDPFSPELAPIRVKTSNDGISWNASDEGTVIFTRDGLQPLSSPYVVWSPATKQLLLSSQADRYFSNGKIAPESQRMVLINTDHGRGDWSWATSPWSAPNSSTLCGSNYSPSLLVLSDSTVRYTAAAPIDTTGLCSERTGAAPIGILPYQTDFSANGQAGWITFGGDWSISGNQYCYSSIDDMASIAVTGSSGWADYEISADIVVTTRSGAAGLSARVSASMAAPDSLKRYTVVIDSMNNKLTAYRVADTTVVLHSEVISEVVQTGKLYHMSFAIQSTNLTVTLTGVGEGISTTFTTSDATLTNGMAGLSGSYGSGSFQNVRIKRLT